MQEEVDATTMDYERASDGSLHPRLMTETAGPPELLNDLVCECVCSHCQTECICCRNDQPYTAAWSCEGTPTYVDLDGCTNPLSAI